MGFEIGQIVLQENYTEAAIWANENAFLLEEHENNTYKIVSRKKEIFSYSQLRESKYPPVADFLDGFVKSNSPDLKIAEEGKAQVASYVSACFAVKQEIPKE